MLHTESRTISFARFSSRGSNDTAQLAMLGGASRLDSATFTLPVCSSLYLYLERLCASPTNGDCQASDCCELASGQHLRPVGWNQLPSELHRY